MSSFAFSLDPRTVLGLGPKPSPEEIRSAYHAKSKKYHPDLGGDEWAFRLVARAYEILTAMPPGGASFASHQTAPREERGDDPRRPGAGDSPFVQSTNGDVEDSRAVPEGLRVVNVELVWTRYERDARTSLSSSGGRGRLDAQRLHGHLLATAESGKPRSRILFFE